MLERQLERLSSRFDSNDMFEVIAQEFHATKKIGWSDHYAKRWRERLAKDVFPWVGKLPLSADRSAHGLAVTSRRNPAGRSRHIQASKRGAEERARSTLLKVPISSVDG